MTPEVKERIEQLRHGIVPEGYIKGETTIMPSNWKEKALEDVVNIFRGASPRPKGDPIYYGGPIPRLLIEDLTRDGKYAVPRLDSLTEEGAKKSRLLPKGSLVMSCSGTRVGITGFLGVDACIHDGFFGFSGYKEIEPEYLYQYFQHFSQNLQSSATHGGVFNNLTTEIMKTMKCCFPPVAEQCKIVEILSAQDKVIELKEKLLTEKQRQKKYLMQQLLSGKKRLPGFDGEWKSEKLSDFCNFIGGGTPDTKNPEYWNGTIPWISSSDLEIGNIHDVAITRYISEDAIRESATKLCKAGTILLVSRVGVGKIAIAPVDLCTSQDFLNLVQQKHNATFLMYSLCLLMQSKSNQVQGSAIKGIPSKEIKEYTLRFPKMDEQEAIALCLSNADREINLLKHNVEQEKQKKKALMQLLLTGIVRVNK